MTIIFYNQLEKLIESVTDGENEFKDIRALEVERYIAVSQLMD